MRGKLNKKTPNTKLVKHHSDYLSRPLQKDNEKFNANRY